MKYLCIALCAAVFTPIGIARAAQANGQAPELKGLLLNVYLESARVQDLLSLAQPASWKTAPEGRSQFTEAAGSMKEGLATLEKWRYQFLYHQDDTEAGKKTLDSLAALTPVLQKLAALAAQGEGAAAGTQYQKAADSFARLSAELQSALAARFPGKFAAEASPTPPAGQPKHLAAAAPPKPAEQPPAEASPKPSAAAAAPPANTPAMGNIPTSPHPAAAVPVMAPGRALTPAELKSLLQNVFLASARVNDLLSIAQPGKWKMSLPERAMFDEKLQSIRAELGGLEKQRYDLLYHPEDISAGQGTVQALKVLGPDLRAVAAAITQYQSASDAAQFSKAAGALESPAAPLESYVNYLLSSRQQQLAAQKSALLAGAKGLQVERVAPRSFPAPISAPVAVAAPPMSPEQVKAILGKIYISDYRIRDLLTQEKPEQWKIPKAEQMMASQARDALIAKIEAAEKWRGLFSQSPDNIYYGFETFITVSDVLHPLWLFSRDASRKEGINVGADYSRRAADLDSQLHLLLPYFRFALKRDQAGYGQYEADLANCQNQLGYAMHGLVRHATPIRNEVPDFQGRRARERKDARRDRR